MNSKLLLKNWNLPECVLKQYENNGLTSMFPWQAECLSIKGVLDGRNLVYAAPTSAGKTLVSEILLLKRVLQTGRKALFILPFISVAREKLFHMRRLFEEAGIRTDGYMGGHAPTNGFSSVDIAICTIEKANGLINRLIEEKNIDQIGMLVIDELHMVGDEGRGYILELLLTKIRFMSKTSMRQSQPRSSIQIVGMSATLPNLDLLAEWLDAGLYSTDFRPVPLQRCLKVGGSIYDDKLKKIRDFVPAFISKNDDDNLSALCYETLHDGNSVLIFCPTKNWCEKLADNIACQFYDLNSSHQNDCGLPHVKLELESLKDIFEQLSRSPVGVDAILNRTLPLGVAYHHAGLTTEERDIVEAGFRIGTIRVLVATSTLSSGVNLPARRVIVRTPMFNRKRLDVRSYLQMTGRAGRKGVDDEGESILLCRPTEQSSGKSLLTAEPLSVKSCLVQSGDEGLTVSMKRAILEIIVNGIASSYESVLDYTSCTLLSMQIARQEPKKMEGPVTRRRSSSLSPCGGGRRTAFNPEVIESCVKWLVEHEFVHLQELDDHEEQGKSENNWSGRVIVATQLGRAALLSSLPTADALTVLADLHQAMKALALDNELHLIYLVTPIFCYNDWTGLDWYQYLNAYESLPNSHKNTATLIGVTEQFLMRMASGAPVPKRGKPAEKIERLLGTHRRFYAALALHDLVQEVSLSTVCSKYSCNRGMLQQLQQSAASFAGMVTTFCQELGWWSLEVLLREFQARLAFGVQRELMDLMQISLLNSQRARALYAAGMTTCKHVSQSDPLRIELVLRNSAHFQTGRKGLNEEDWEAEERRKQRSIHVTGQRGLTEHEAAVKIIEEAKRKCGGDLAGVNNPHQVAAASIKTSLCRQPSSPAACESHHRNLVHETKSEETGRHFEVFNAVADREKVKVQSREVTLPSIPPGGAVKKKPPCQSVSLRSEVKGESNEAASLSRAMSQITDGFCLEKATELDSALKVIQGEKNICCASSESSVTDTQLRLLLEDGDSMDDSFAAAGPKTLPDIVLDSLENPNEIPGCNSFSEDSEGFVFSSEGEDDRRETEVKAEDEKKIVDQSTGTVESSGFTALLHDAELSLMNSDSDSQRGNIASSCTGNTDKILEGSFAQGIKGNGEEDVTVCFPCKSVVEQDSGISQRLDENHFSVTPNKLPGNSAANILNGLSDKILNDPVSQDSNSNNSLSMTLEESFLSLPTTTIPITLVWDGESSDDMMDEEIAVPCFLNSKSENELEGCIEGLKNEGAAETLLTDSQLHLVFDGSFTPEGKISSSLREKEPKFSSENLAPGLSETSLMTENGEGLKVASNCAALSPGTLEAMDSSFSCSLTNNSSDVESKKISNVAKDDKVVTSSPEKVLRETCHTLSSMSHGKLLLQEKIEKNDGEISKSLVNSTPKLEKQAKTQQNKFLNVKKNHYASSPYISAAQMVSEATPIAIFCPTTPRVGDKTNEALSDNSVEDLFDLSSASTVLGLPKQEAEVKEIPAAQNLLDGALNFSDSPDESLVIMPATCSTLGSAAAKSERKRKSPDSVSSPISKKLLKTGGSPGSLPLETSTSRAEFLASENLILSSQKDRKKKGAPKRTQMKARKAILASEATQYKSISDLSTKPSANFSEDLNFSLTDVTNSLLDHNDVVTASPETAVSAPNLEASVKVTRSQIGPTIVDVCSQSDLFDIFMKEWSSKTCFSIAVATLSATMRQDKGGIGVSSSGKKTVTDVAEDAMGDAEVVGIAVCWGQQDAYYVSLESTENSSERSLYSKMAEFSGLVPPPNDVNLNAKKRIADFDCALRKKNCVLVAMDIKTQYKVLRKLVEPANSFWQDPSMASWLLDPSADPKTLIDLVDRFAPRESYLFRGLNNCCNFGSIACCSKDCHVPARIRACAEAVSCYRLMKELKRELKDVNMWNVFSNVEMPHIRSLALLELNGIGFDKNACALEAANLHEITRLLEKRAYELAKKQFNLGSPAEVAKVLFGDLGLSLEGEGDSTGPATVIKPGMWRRGNRKGKNGSWSTKKEVLEKLKNVHPLPGIVLSWRQVTYALAKSVHPFRRVAVKCEKTKMYRIYPKCIAQSVTGRVSIVEPNVQNVPKAFSVKVPDVQSNESGPERKVCIRDHFIASKGHVLLAADYSQLEIRIFAHLSGDEKLLKILNSEFGDVFKMIAAQWKGTEAGSVTAEERQRAKQICYGMLYGIGAKALSQQLKVKESDAEKFMESFLCSFPSMRAYIRRLVRDCVHKGYVETLCGRRRYLPTINGTNMSAKSQAERQAVNTTVQGSAADIIKMATIDMHKAMKKKWDILISRNCSDKSTTRRAKSNLGCYLVLHLHDELMFEVREDILPEAASLVRSCMEKAAKLKVRLPVKISAGTRWGRIQEYSASA